MARTPTLVKSPRTSRAAAPLVALLLLALAPSQVGCGLNGGHPAVERADLLFAESRWEEAASAYQSLPEGAGAWRPYGNWRAATIFRDALQDPGRAEEAFDLCSRSYPEEKWGYVCRVDLGDLRRDTGEPRGAIDAYRGALELRPKGSYAEHCLLESGRAYLTLGAPSQARVEWEELLSSFPKSRLAPEVGLELARSYDLQRDH